MDVLLAIAVMTVNPEYMKFVIEYVLIYIMCFGGLLTKDLLYSSKHKVKLELKSTILSAIPSTILMAAVYSTFSKKNFDVTVWAFACYIAGLYSREILCVLTNSKLAALLLKTYVKYMMSKVADDMSDKDKDIIDNAMDELEKEMTEGNTNSNKEPPAIEKKDDDNRGS